VGDLVGGGGDRVVDEGVDDVVPILVLHHWRATATQPTAQPTANKTVPHKLPFEHLLILPHPFMALKTLGLVLFRHTGQIAFLDVFIIFFNDLCAPTVHLF